MHAFKSLRLSESARKRSRHEQSHKLYIHSMSFHYGHCPGNVLPFRGRWGLLLHLCTKPTLLLFTQNTVLKVFETERNMYYIHKGSKMYTSRSIIQAYSIAVCLRRCSVRTSSISSSHSKYMPEGVSFHLYYSSGFLCHVLFYYGFCDGGRKILPFLCIRLPGSLHVHVFGSNARGSFPGQSNSARIWIPCCKLHVAIFWHIDSPR